MAAMEAARASRSMWIGRKGGLLFSSGHFLRVLAVCWLVFDSSAGKYSLLGTTSLSALSCEHNPSQPVIWLW